MRYFFSLFFGTFLLEDVALASSIGLMAENKLGLLPAFLACFVGISLGDIGLYILGYASSQFGLEQRMGFLKKHRATLREMKNSPLMTYSIFVSRALPGTRLPTYVGAGFLRYSFWKFFLVTLLSVALWVSIAFCAGKSIHAIFMDRWIISIIFFLICLKVLKFLIPKLTDHWERKALWQSWRQWTSYEFWPSLIFYLPIVPYYIYLSIKYKSLFTPFYANHHMANGGLIGESKWDFLQYLDPTAASTLASIKIGKDLDFMETRELLEKEGFVYPFIMKPDVGQRGFGVRVIRNDFDLTEYLLLSNFTRIVQRLSILSREAGLFYVRLPSEKVGRIFSITDKRFPFVVGDGKTKLGDLILRDARAKIIASIYFARWKKELDSIPDQGTLITLAECGNHCQGAIFYNGEELFSPMLEKELDRIAQKIPDFYFGRFDVRYQDVESLKRGKNFEIVEVNGAGSEATHIWDARTQLFDAYRTLFEQWSLLFFIGDEVKKRLGNKTQVNVASFLKECAKVAFRKERLSTSS